MASSEKNYQSWIKLSSEQAVNQQKNNEEYKDKLIVIIFNSNTVRRFDPELALEQKRQQYEDSNNVTFFKCNVKDIDDALPTAFKVADVPTFIFYRNGKECDRLQRPKEEVLFAKLDQLMAKQN